MRNYYNECDPFAAEWLRGLVSTGLIPPGVVDERSIVDVEPKELERYTQCHFFAGIGGWSRALELAGWPADRPVWTGSPPCQPFSEAGKHAGKDDERHLWPAFFNLIREFRPTAIFGEQVAASVRYGWLDDVQDDLESIGYASGAAILPAGAVGAPHKRERLFFTAKRVGYADEPRLEGLARPEDNSEQRSEAIRPGASTGFWDSTAAGHGRDGKRRPIPTESEVFPLADGVSNRLGILRGAGNAIVPQAAAEIIKAVM